jgi:hypothetical protein
MRTTVGPLPSAVYWRRRAVVLGALLLGIIVLFVSCSGNDKNPRGQGPGSQPPASTPASGSAGVDPTPSFLDNVPAGSGPSLPAPGDLEPQVPGDDDDDAGVDGSSALPTIGGAGANGQNTNVTAASDGTCADTEIALTPAPAITTVKRGAAVVIGLTIKNIGSRTCARDVGADPQELYLSKDARTYWSSDTCSTDKGSNVRQLAASAQLTFKVTWNGRQSSSCSNGMAAGPNPPPGQFELRARLGTLVSAPVLLTITA